MPGALGSFLFPGLCCPSAPGAAPPALPWAEVTPSVARAPLLFLGFTTRAAPLSSCPTHGEQAHSSPGSCQTLVLWAPLAARALTREPPGLGLVAGGQEPLQTPRVPLSLRQPSAGARPGGRWGAGGLGQPAQRPGTGAVPRGRVPTPRQPRQPRAVLPAPAATTGKWEREAERLLTGSHFVSPGLVLTDLGLKSNFSFDQKEENNKFNIWKTHYWKLY